MGLDQILHPTSNIKFEAFNNSWNMPLMTSLIIVLSVDPNSWILFLKQFTS